MEIQYREWGEGPPLLALHGLGLESSSFTGLAHTLAGRGLRTLAADLPGFGRTPAPDAPLSPAVLADPVLDLARRLESKPLVLGMSMGARVALEAVLREPGLFRGVVLLAPPLPRREADWIRVFARLLSPKLAERMPIERAWPWLKKRAERLEAELAAEPEHDWFVRAGRRTIYYMSCPATRRAFVSAARELALDPPSGPRGVWARLECLRLPAAFVWCDKDRFIPMENVPHVAALLPGAFQIHVPCAGHYKNGPHYRCQAEGAIEGVRLVEAAARSPGAPAGDPEQPRFIGCAVASDRRGGTPS